MEEPKVVFPGNTGRMDSCRLGIRLKLPHDVRDSSGGGGSENMTPEDLLPEECLLCGKRFGSAKALDGHMRIHSQGHRDRGVRSFRSAKLSSSSLDDEKPQECGVCGKKFPSRKSLCGHMRLHPDRGWRGIQPPAKEVDLVTIIDSPWVVVDGLSVTGKHGGKSTESITSGLNLASTMAGSSTQGTSEEVKQGDATGNSPRTAVETEIPPEKKPLEDPQVKAEEASGQNPCAGVEDKELKQGMKRKARELDGTDNGCCAKKVAGEPHGHTSATNYPCKRCSKSFPTFQALGGHMSSCNKTKQTVVGQAVEANAPGTCSWHPQLDLMLSLSLYTPGSPTSNDAGCTCTMDLQLNVNVPPTSREDPDENERKMIKFL